METPITALTHSGTKFFASPDGNFRQLYLGVRITLSEKFTSQSEVIQFIQDKFYEDIGATGNFWLMPESYKDTVTKDFSGFKGRDLSESVRFNEDNTIVELLLCTEDYAFIDEELNAFSLELTELVLRKLATKYEQFWLY